MTKENKDYGKSIKAKLLNLSKAEGLSYQPLLIHYMQERLLYRLAQSKYKHCFYLKGGALLYAHEQFKARPTLDIDFLGHRGCGISAFRLSDTERVRTFL